MGKGWWDSQTNKEYIKMKTNHAMKKREGSKKDLVKKRTNSKSEKWGWEME